MILAAVMAATVAMAAQARDAVDYVNPMIGATTADEGGRGDVNELGKTFPGVCTPLGLVQLSPDTHTGGDNDRVIPIITRLLKDSVSPT